MPALNSTDSNFERTVSDLAYARLRDKAPTLLDYIIGFQLIDKNDDETHAVGVFGFKVGSEWVYAPIFYINGELKGHELMYLKNQDAFVPLVEEWVNYILNRRPQVMGKTEQTPRSQLGLRQPDFDLFSRAPYIGSKMASARRTAGQIKAALDQNGDKDFSFAPFMDVFSVTPRHKKFASMNRRMDLRGALKVLGKQAAYTLVNSMRKDEKFADAVLKFYDLKDLLNFEKTAEKEEQTDAGYQTTGSHDFCKDCQHFMSPHSCEIVSGDISPSGTCKYFKASGVKDEIKPVQPIKAAASGDTQIEGTRPVVVITRQDSLTSVMKDMSEEDKRKLLKDNYVVKDERTKDQKARLYKTQIAMQYQNPSEDGYYEVATAKGSRRKVLILTSPINTGYAGDWEQGKCLVVDLESKRFGLFHNTDILAHHQLDRKEWDKEFSSMSASKSLTVDDVACFVTPRGNGTIPFRVDKKWTNAEGQTELSIHTYYMSTTGASMMPRRAYGYQNSTPIGEPCTPGVSSIVLTGKDGENITQIGSTLFVPSSAKAVKLPKEFKYSMGGTLDIGTLPEIVLGIYKSASPENGVHRFQVRTDGIRFHTVRNDAHGSHLSKVAMIKHLIVDHGLGQEDAEFLVKRAEPRKATTYYLKYAARHDDNGSVPNSPTFSEPNYADTVGLHGRAQYPQTEAQNLGSDLHSNRDAYRNDIYIDDTAKSNAQSASQKGQKEVLDTSVVAGLVKTMDTDSLVDSYISDMLLGLDRIGRVLFMYYWHNDKFKERYGQQDMHELEDNLRNVFKNMGELTLFLKQKTVEPDQASNSEVQLTDVLM